MQLPPPGLDRLGRLDVILVRHARAIPPGTPGWEGRDNDRPLTDQGRRDADELAIALEPYVIWAIYSSPYARALQTVDPTARIRAMRVNQIADLRERLLTPISGPDAEWRDHYRRSWHDPDYAAPGGESGRAAQRRGIGTLDLLRVRHPDGGAILVSSHGNLISLILQAFEPEIGLEFAEAMPMPAIYHLEHDGIGWRVMGGQGFREIAATN
jgi:2,3-bisphosphoglycerate-dependent phosphoglycerate mutase